MNIDPPPAAGALESAGVVQAMFGRISARYDLANTVLSGGLDFWWRRRAAQVVRAWRPARLLDLATGSGALAAGLQRTCPDAMIVGADFSLPMLRRAKSARRLTRLVVADAMALPFSAGAFDAVTVAFGLRNMPSYAGALREMRRVLRPGGRLLILDFCLPRRRWSALYRWYLRRVLPWIADRVCGERGAYEYLGESIARFPRGTAMETLLAEAGFQEPHTEELSGGIVALYTARNGADHSIQSRML